MKEKRIVITGYGVISSLAIGKKENAEKLFGGFSGIQNFAFSYRDGDVASPCGVCRMPLPEHPFFREKEIECDRGLNLALYAADECMAESKLIPGFYDDIRCAVVVGTSLSGMRSADLYHTAWLEKGIGKADPRYIKPYPLHVMADILAAHMAFCGPRAVVSTACSSGPNAVGEAADMILNGLCDCALAGGADPISRFSFAGFSALKAISRKPCSPFSGSNGINLGEGAAFFFLEIEENAKKRGVTPVCYLRGYGITADAYHPTAPDPTGNGAVRAMRQAMLSGGADIREISYINGHGTGTPANDRAETAAWKNITGGSSSILMTSNKASVGHCMGAAGAVELAFSIMSMEYGKIPPALNPDPEKESVSGIPRKTISCEVENVLSNSFAFGGNNCSVMVSKKASPELREIPEDEIVITGIGCCGTGGTNVKELFETFRTGRSCIEKIDVGDKDYRCMYRGELPNIPLKKYIPSRIIRRTDRVTGLAMVSGKQALGDSGLTVTPENCGRIGVIYGTGTGPISTIETISRNMIQKGISGVTADIFPNSVLNAAPGQFSIANMLKGVTSTVSLGQCSGLLAFIYAAMLLKEDQADAIVVLSADEWTDALQAGNDVLHLLTSEGSLPFSVSADGSILSEGSAAFVLERKSFAKKRNAEILCRVRGYGAVGQNTDLYRFTDEHGMEDCFSMALGDSRSDIIDYYASSALGAPSLDIAEAKFIEQNLTRASVRSIAQYTGTPSGSIGCYGLLSCIYAISRDHAPAAVKTEDRMIPGMKEILGRENSGHIRNAAAGAYAYGGSAACVWLDDDIG